MGPTLKFQRDTVIAVTGADMQPKLDGQPVPLWESIPVKAGQTLALGPAKVGTRTYIAIAGGIDTPPWLGSRSTFHKAGVGGMEGHALKPKQVVPVASGKGTAGRKVKPDARPQFATDKRWTVEVVRGPNDDWVDNAGHDRFLSTDWKLSAKSDRTGFRLEGPQWSFTEKATKKAPEHGSEPSNIIDQGYPLGAINLAGQTPIILVNDGPSMGGFICPYTVPSAAFWKLGQSRPGDLYRFKSISVDEAQELRKKLKALCTSSSII
jgi:urea carboxylase